MWLLTLLFVLTNLWIGWMLFVYLHVIWFVGVFRPRKEPVFPSEWPRISVIVPCYNEQERIIDKLENLRKLDYPRDRLEIVFADGGSRDSTVSLLKEAIRDDEPIRLVACPLGGKINQINHVLPSLGGEIIVNTDVDADVAADSLQWIAGEFNINPNAWVVGAYCRPSGAIAIEEYYWQTQNKGRYLESDAGACPIAIAQCYAFRKELLEAFPEDVVADDIYVALLASTLGRDSVYSRHAAAFELRGPANVVEFLSHKLRKSNAYLRETLRFVYRLPEMSTTVRVMLLTRISQQLLLPWAMVLWLLIAGALLTLFRFDLVTFGVVFLLVLLLVSRSVFQSIKLPQESSASLGTILTGYILTNVILLATALSYPYLRQDSSYSRLASDTPAKAPVGPGNTTEEDSREPDRGTGA